MADTKASAFSTTTTMASSDVLPVITGMGTSPAQKIITKANFKTDLALVKADVGLSNVDNTADTAKPISTATQTALDLKAPIASPTFTGTVAGVTKSMVGLSNVDNTSDATKNAAVAALTNKDLTSGTNTFPTLNQNTTGNAGSANALKSATTTIDVSAATAPSSGQVLTATDSTHATWQIPPGGASDIIANLSYDFSQTTYGSGNRYTGDSSGGSTTLDPTGGTALLTASTGTSRRMIHDAFLVDGFNVYDQNPFFTFVGFSFIGGTTVQALIGMGQVYNYFNTSVDASGKGFGFRFYISGGVTFTEGFAKDTGGTLQTVDLAHTGNAGSAEVFTARMISGSNVKFYINGTLAGTISTGLPTGAPYQANWRASIYQSAGSSASQFNLNNLSHGYKVG